MAGRLVAGGIAGSIAGSDQLGEVIVSWVAGDRSVRAVIAVEKVRDLAAKLPANDPLTALERISSWLESINSADNLKLRERLALIDVLDQAAKNPHQKLAHEYISAHGLQKSQEARLWRACSVFTRNLGTGYIQCIEQAKTAQASSEEMEKSLPVLAGRALRALTVRLKCSLQRYELDDRIWRDLATVYLFAEAHGFASRRAAIYPGRHGQSSAREEFLKAMMLAVSGADSLLAHKLHLVERLVAHFGSAFNIRPEPALGCPFFIDLSAHKPPSRTYRSMQRGAMTRFFGPGEAALALRAFARQIEEAGTLPGDVNLGGDFDSETVLEVLAHLEEHWSAVPPARGAARRPIATRVTVIPGFPQTLGWLHAVQATGALEHVDPAGSESWIVHDASDGGYGVIVPNAMTDWLHVGVVVGLRTEAAAACRVGVVRRITQDDFGQRRVGIEVLGKFAFPVKVSPAEPGAAGGGVSQTEEAILLSKQPDQNGEIALLLAAGRFTPEQRLQVQIRDKEYLALPSTLIESGKEFDWANLKVTKQH